MKNLETFRYVLPCTKYEKKKIVLPLKIFIKNARMRRSIAVYVATVQPLQFPNSRPEAKLVLLRRGGQTSGPSKLDGFNRLIIVWIFHRAIFLLNNVQREIQRSLLSSVRASPVNDLLFFRSFPSKLWGSTSWVKSKETNERTKSRYCESRTEDWKFRSLEYVYFFIRFFVKFMHNVNNEIQVEQFFYRQEISSRYLYYSWIFRK